MDAEKLAHWRQHLQSQQQVSEALASQFLADFDIPMVVGTEVATESQLVKAAGLLSYPLVLKTAASGIAHKSDQGGVILNIISQAELLEAYQDLSHRLGSAAMVAPMVEVQGISTDKQFGPVVVLGFGGLYAEMLKDTTVLLPPFDSASAVEAIGRLKMSPMLAGVRGSSPVDVQAYAEAAARLSVLAVEFADLIAEIDINPVKVLANGAYYLAKV